MTQLLAMQTRLSQEISRYEASERSWRNRWIVLEGLILAIGLLTPTIVIYRKSGLFPTEFWVWWCTITPLLAAAATIIMRVTGVQDHCLTNRRRVRKVQYLLNQTNIEIPLCKDDEHAERLIRGWSADLSKIEHDY